MSTPVAPSHEITSVQGNHDVITGQPILILQAVSAPQWLLAEPLPANRATSLVDRRAANPEFRLIVQQDPHGHEPPQSCKWERTCVQCGTAFCTVRSHAVWSIVRVPLPHGFASRLCDVYLNPACFAMRRITLAHEILKGFTGCPKLLTQSFAFSQTLR